MSNIQPYQGSDLLLLGDARRAGRSISRYQAHGQVRSAAIDVETNLALDKLYSLTAVTGQAMGAVVRVAQAQKQLELLAPETSGRLSLLADEHTLALAEVTAEHRRVLRRK